MDKIDIRLTDDGTLLPEDCLALVLDGSGRAALVVPKTAEDRDTVPASWVVLQAVIILLGDESWVEQMCSLASHTTYASAAEAGETLQ